MSKDTQRNNRKLQNLSREEKRRMLSENRRKMIKELGERYVNWYEEKMSDFKVFWVNEFVFPMFTPLISMAILRYIFKYSFSKEQGMILFVLFFLTTVTGRLLGKYKKLIKVLDPLIDEVRELKDGGKKKKKN
jgi:hypothetical protein